MIRHATTTETTTISRNANGIMTGVSTALAAQTATVTPSAPRRPQHITRPNPALFCAWNTLESPHAPYMLFSTTRWLALAFCIKLLDHIVCAMSEETYHLHRGATTARTSHQKYSRCVSKLYCLNSRALYLAVKNR